jgi:hypothetical protein
MLTATNFDWMDLRIFGLSQDPVTSLIFGILALRSSWAADARIVQTMASAEEVVHSSTRSHARNRCRTAKVKSCQCRDIYHVQAARGALTRTLTFGILD